MATPVYVGIFGDLNMREVAHVVSVSFSWTLDEVSQCEVQLIDPDFRMLNNNYFQVRRDILVADELFNIATVRVSQGEGSSPNITLEGRRLGIQQMKRDKDPGSIQAATATEYAEIAAGRYNLKFQGQATSVVPNIASITESSADESLWDVLKSLAGEAQFVLFESDNILYFASEQWLFGKYGLPQWFGGSVQFYWPDAPSGVKNNFPLLEIPEVYTSDDDPYAADFRAVVARTNGTQLRPGMTVYLDAVPHFRGNYLITEVSYTLDSPDPVSVSGRTPQPAVDKDGKKMPEYRELLG